MPEDSAEADELSGGRAVVALKAAKSEARKILTDLQYWWVVDIVKQLSGFGIPDGTTGLDIKSFGKFYELRLKGGVLRKLNLRIYFGFESATNQIIVLKTYKKEKEGKAPDFIMVTLEDRFEAYCEGRLSDGVSLHRRRQDDVIS